MKLFLIISIILLYRVGMYAQAPDTQWTRAYGGFAFDAGLVVQELHEGGFIIGGSTSSFGAGSRDIYLLKVTASGDTLWTRTIGGGGADECWALDLTCDGGFVLIGPTNSYGAGEDDIFLVKTDGNGETLWTRTYGGSQSDIGSSVKQASDSGYIFTGWTRQIGTGLADLYIVKTTENGDVVWERTYGGIYSDYGSEIIETDDRGFLAVGTTGSSGAGRDDVFLVKVDSAGNLQWGRTYGGPEMDVGYSVCQSEDGRYLVVGGTMSFGAGSYDVFAFKVDSSGDVLWSKTYGGSGWDEAFSVKRVNGGYVIAGMTNSFGSGGYDFYLLRIDENGDTLWSATFGGSGWEECHSVCPTSDGGYILAGLTNSFGSGDHDVYLVKTMPEPTEISEMSRSEPSPVQVTFVPNPFRKRVQITYELGSEGAVSLDIYDVTGKLVRSLVHEHQQPGVHSILWEGIDNACRVVPRGVYLARLVLPDHVVRTAKLIFKP